jgi:hypothetical protein
MQNKMKKVFLTLLTMASISAAMAQAPKLMNYQGIMRTTDGKAMVNQQVQIKISIIDGTQEGNVVYTEEQAVTTNQFGLYNIKIGEGKPIVGNIETIKWQAKNKYIKVELDSKDGNGYVDMGTTQLLSVPYALYAETAGTALNANGTDKAARAGSANYLSKFDATGASNAEINSQLFDNGASVGINTTAPGAKLHVFQNTPASNVLLMEHTDSTGFGRFAFYNDAGFANRATFTRYGSKNTSTIAPLFPAANLLAFGCNKGSFLISTGGDAGISVINSGTSRLKFFAEDSTLNVGIGGSAFPQSRVHVSNTDGTNTDVRITNNTTGHLATDGLVITENGNAASITNTENSSLSLGTNNTARVAIGANGNVVVNAPTSGNALQVNGTMQITGGAPGAGKVLTSDATGNATWQTPASGGGGGSYTAGTGINIVGNVINNSGDLSNTNELQTLSLAGNNLSLSNGGGTVALPSATTYTGGSGITITGNVVAADDASPTNELQTLSLSGNTLTLSNGGGSVTLPSGGGGTIGGSGTTNYVPKFTPNGTTLGNSQIFDNGNVGIGTPTPAAKLDVSSTSSNTANFNGPNNMYLSFEENGAYKGYIGSFAGNANDVDFGTGGGNNSGAVHLTIKAIPALTVDSNTNVGIGTTTPETHLTINKPNASMLINATQNTSNLILRKPSTTGYNSIIFQTGTNLSTPDWWLDGSITGSRNFGLFNGNTFSYTLFANRNRNNIGINTANPDSTYSLDVRGGLRNGISSKGTSYGVYGSCDSNGIVPLIPIPTAGVYGTTNATFLTNGVMGIANATGSGPTAAGVLGWGQNGATGVRAIAVGASSVALEVGGSIQVSGSNANRFAQVLTQTIASNQLAIPTSMSNDPNDIVMVQHVFVGQYITVPVGVWWNGSQWRIYTEDTTKNINIGEKFNVIVIKN